VLRNQLDMFLNMFLRHPARPDLASVAKLQAAIVAANHWMLSLGPTGRMDAPGLRIAVISQVLPVC
jgi:hypothetical protein